MTPAVFVLLACVYVLAVLARNTYLDAVLVARKNQHQRRRDAVRVPANVPAIWGPDAE